MARTFKIPRNQEIRNNSRIEEVESYVANTGRQATTGYDDDISGGTNDEKGSEMTIKVDAEYQKNVGLTDDENKCNEATKENPNKLITNDLEQTKKKSVARLGDIEDRVEKEKNVKATDSVEMKAVKKQRLDNHLHVTQSTNNAMLSSILSDLGQKFSKIKRPSSPVHSIPIEFCTRNDRKEYMTDWIHHQEKKAESCSIDYKWFDDAIDMVKDGRAKILVENGYNMYGDKLREGRNFFDKVMAEEYGMYDWIPEWVRNSKSALYDPLQNTTLNHEQD